MVLLLQVKYFVYPFLELVDVFILAFSHCFVPLVGFSLDLLPYRSKVSVGYGLVCLGEYYFDNVGVGYPLNC